MRYWNVDLPEGGRSMKGIPVRWKLIVCMGLLLSGILYAFGGRVFAADSREEGERSERPLHEIYGEDDRFRLVSQESFAYEKEQPIRPNSLGSQYLWVNQSYEAEEIAKSCHATFDGQNRLLYALGYTANILGDSSSYCEERIYERDDTGHARRYLYYKSNSIPYEDGYYIGFRYLFEDSEFQYDEEGRLLRCLTYRRNVGSDPNGYSEELFFDRGYQAEYEDGRLTAELQYYDYWGTNETGSWEYRIYQYDEQGDCVLWVAVTEDEILLCCLEYQEETGQLEQYTYQVLEEWELSCEDGSTYELRPQYGKPAVRKAAANGTVERELFYGKGMDLGQQHYQMPEEIEATLEDHYYVVAPGDCLWNISGRCYGQGRRCDLIWRMNRSVIGSDPDLLMPGTRLYLPEAGNAQDTRVGD